MSKYPIRRSESLWPECIIRHWDMADTGSEQFLCVCLDRFFLWSQPSVNSSTFAIGTLSDLKSQRHWFRSVQDKWREEVERECKIYELMTSTKWRPCGRRREALVNTKWSFVIRRYLFHLFGAESRICPFFSFFLFSIIQIFLVWFCILVFGRGRNDVWKDLLIFHLPRAAITNRCSFFPLFFCLYNSILEFLVDDSLLSYPAQWNMILFLYPSPLMSVLDNLHRSTKLSPTTPNDDDEICVKPITDAIMMAFSHTHRHTHCDFMLMARKKETHPDGYRQNKVAAYPPKKKNTEKKNWNKMDV